MFLTRPFQNGRQLKDIQIYLLQSHTLMHATNDKNETSLKQVLKQSDYDKLYVVIQKLASEKNITI